MSKSLKIFFIPSVYYLLLTTLFGCGPTYPKASVEKSIIDVCKKEYNADVKVKIIGNTLGVYIPIQGLFDISLQSTSAKSIADFFSGVKFKKEAAERIDDTILATTRVVLSTDSKLDFYVAVAHDEKTSDIELVFTRNILDIKRIMTGDISRGDYLARLLIDIRINTKSLAEKAVRNLFNSLKNEANTQQVLNTYFLKPYIISSGKFLLILQENMHKENIDYLIEDLKLKRINPYKVLAFCRVKETYLPKKEKTPAAFTYPSGFREEYVMLLDATNLDCKIERIIPLYFLDANKNLVKFPYPQEYEKFGSPNAWIDDDFLFEEIKLEDFLARQITERIKASFQNNAQLKKIFKILSLDGQFAIKEKKFIFKIIIIKNNLNRLSDEEASLILKNMLDVARSVIRRYEFKDFDAIEVIEESTNKKAAASRDYLKKTGRWSIRIEELITK